MKGNYMYRKVFDFISIKHTVVVKNMEQKQVIT